MSIDVRVRELMIAKYGTDAKKWPSMVELADMLEVQPATVSAWLKRRVDRANFDILDKWCEFFGVGVGDILVRIPPEKRKR